LFAAPYSFTALDICARGGGTVLSRTAFEISDAVSAILAEPDPKACTRVFQKTIAAFGIDTFACGEVDLANLERCIFYAIGWPNSWRKFYLESGLVQRDPILDAMKRRHLPFTWSELRRDRKLSILGSEGLQLIAAHGWTEGLAVPIPRGDYRFGLVSLACKRGPFSDKEKSLLAMLSLCFHERVRNLAPKHGCAVAPVGLTKREIDVLQLIARGTTDRKVGQKLGISPSTAHEHFENAKKKLKVSTRAEAIAIAVSLAIVAP
jgi:DNA-binding CsgD family transcriptional regulator